jgi:penicillin-binding protein 2
MRTCCGVSVQRVEITARGRLRVLQRTRRPRPVLTLDSRLQDAAEKAFGDSTGSAIALDPRNGDILALVSMPTYDPNPFVNGIEYADYKALKDDEKQPLFNRALRGQYPPGSTVKPFMGLAGMEQGITSGRSSTYCGVSCQATRKYRDWKHTGHGTVNLGTAITHPVTCVSMTSPCRWASTGSMIISRTSGSQPHRHRYPGELPGLLPSAQWKRERRDQPGFPADHHHRHRPGFFHGPPLQLAAAHGAGKPRPAYQAIHHPCRAGSRQHRPAAAPAADRNHFRT